MGRFSRFNGNQKAVAAGVAQTIIFPAAEIESTGVVMYQLQWTGANPPATTVNRIRVRQSGSTLFDASPAQLFAFQQRFARANFPDTAASQILSIPFFLPDAPTIEAADICQFPLGAQAQVEIEFLAAVAAGSCIITWTQTDVAPVYLPRYYGIPLNIPASTLNGKFAFSESGVVRGLTLPMTGIQRATATISGRNAWDLPGANFAGLTLPAPGLIGGKDAMYDGQTQVTPKCLSVDLGIAAAFGSSYLTLDTGAAWAGVANEMAIYAVDEQAIMSTNPAASGGQNAR